VNTSTLVFGILIIISVTEVLAIVLSSIIVAIPLIVLVIIISICSYVEKISAKTKNLIEEFALCNDQNNHSSEFKNLYQKFNTTLLVKNFHLTILGLISISGTTIVTVILFIFTVSPKARAWIDLLSPSFQNNSNTTAILN